MYNNLPTIQALNKEEKIMTMKKFFAQKTKFQNFEKLNQDDCTKIEKKVKDYLKSHEKFSYYIEKNIHIVMAYELLEEKEMTYDEKVLAYIIAVDKNLKALRIYEEESLIQNIKKRCLEELRFYNDTFIKFEKSFLKKFKNNMSIEELQMEEEQLKNAREELIHKLTEIKNLKNEKMRTFYLSQNKNEKSIKSLKEMLLENPQNLEEYELRLKKRKKEKKVLPSTHYNTDFYNRLNKKKTK